MPKFSKKEPIGRGAVGTVYKAWDEARGEHVALKVLHAKHAGDKRIVKRFKREIELGQAFDHPGIIKIFESGKLDGEHFYSMEYVAGETLHKRALGKTLDPMWVVEMVSEVARALEYAHKQGVVHRDIKPNNIIVDEGGHPKLFDLGIAKDERSGVNLTRVDEAVGTPWYMAPEQFATARSVDHRADIFSLGVVLYELLTGERPFKGKHAVEVARNMVKWNLIPPHKINSDVPKSLDAVCRKSMFGEVDWRYSSAGAFADDLDRVHVGKKPIGRAPGIIDRVARSIESQPLALVVGFLGLLAVVGGLLYWIY